MTRLRIYFHRLLGLFMRRKLERELEEEIRSHLEMQIEDDLRQGMSLEEAHRAARLKFGGVEQVKEAYRDKSRFGWIEDLWQDLRYGVRMLLKKPGLTLVAVLTLSLGIGANTAIFSVVNMILRPLPVQRPEELAAVFAYRGDPGDRGVHTYRNYIYLRDHNSVFSGLAAHKPATVAISADERPGERANEHTNVISGEIVSGNFFDVLGVRPALGRAFTPEEDRAPNAHPVVVLSYGLWQRRFSSDPELVGRSVYLNGRPFTVIGISPPSFKGREFGLEMDFWAPIMMQAQLGSKAEWFKENSIELCVLGRLKPGVTRWQADSHLYALAQGLAQMGPGGDERIMFYVVSEVEGRQQSVFALNLLIGALALGLSGLVTLAACANVANLLLARATARSREIVIRLALGAGRSRIIRQLLTESMLLALLGGALGLLLAIWSAELLRAGSPFMNNEQMMVVDFSPDLRVLGWAAAVSLLTGILFGLAPARHAARTDLIPTLKNETCAGSVGSRRSSPRNLLVIAQLAISVVVLVCAGLFVKGMYKAQTANPGFQPENLLSVRLDPGLVGYDGARAKVFFTDLVQQVETLPGVRTASLASNLPFGMSGVEGINGIVKEGDAPSPLGKELGVGGNMENFFVEIKSVGPKYFETMGAPLALGRGFTERDKGKAPEVVIINQAAARHFYGSGQQALGKRLRLEPKSPWLEIVGIAQDGHLQEPRPYLLTPFLQGVDQTRMTLIVRATSANEFNSIAESVRREARKLDARVPVFQLKLGEDHVRPVLRARRYFAAIAATLAVIAVALAGMGLYGVMAYAVSLRTKEIGIRMALGAKKADVLGMMLRQGMFLTLLGVAIGLGAAFALTNVVMYLFAGVGATDLLTYVVISLLLTFVALLACWIPARRATKVDPLIALRYE
ncbi:MAG TPA: ABC transporter permease [Blastocatellia bacterium]|nr:ABC transporter permease [Blastocatellia bacterium]